MEVKALRRRWEEEEEVCLPFPELLLSDPEEDVDGAKERRV